MRELTVEEVARVTGGSADDEYYNGWAAPYLNNPSTLVPSSPFNLAY